MSKFRLLRLLSPLIIVIVITAVLSYKFSQSFASNYLINIATDFLGIIITVVYVDQVVKSYERQKWESARALIFQRLSYYARDTLTELIELFKITPSLSEKTTKLQSMYHRGEQRPDNLISDLTESYLHDVFGNGRTYLQNIAQIKDWRMIRTQLTEIEKISEQLITTFATQIDPDILTTVLNIQEALLRLCNITLYSDGEFNTLFPINLVQESFADDLAALSKSLLFLYDSTKKPNLVSKSP